jgi:hypothetical protein
MSKGGRRALAPQHRRTLIVKARFSPDEYRLLSRLASPFPISTYLRLQALHKQPAPLSRVPAANLHVIGELQRIGNNLNQAVHLLHTGVIPPSFGEVLRTLQTELRAYHRSLLGQPAEEPNDL